MYPSADVGDAPEQVLERCLKLEAEQNLSAQDQKA
jgi:hypothetical protein